MTTNEFLIESVDELIYKYYSLNKDVFSSIDFLDQYNSQTKFFDCWSTLFNSQKAFNEKEYSLSKDLSLKIINELKPSYSLIIAESYNILGRLARLFKLEKDATNYYNLALEVFKAEKNFFGIYGSQRILFNQANLFLLNSELQKALLLYDEVFNTLKSLNVLSDFKTDIALLLVRILQNKGLAHLYLGKTNDSKNCFESALALLSNDPHKETEANLLLNYSNLSIVMEDDNLTEKLLTKAYQLYKELNNSELYNKIYIDLVKISLYKNKNEIDPLLVDNLIVAYNNAKGKEIPIRVVEIAEYLFAQKRFSESAQLVDFVLTQDLQLDLKGKALYLLLNLSLHLEKYGEAVETGEELLVIANYLKDKASIISINIMLLKAKYILNKDVESLKENLKENLSYLLNGKEYNALIDSYENFFKPLWDNQELSTIIYILENFENKIIKKSKAHHIKDYHDNDLVILYALLQDSKAIKLFKSKNITIEDIVQSSRFKYYLEDQNSEYRIKIQEFLQVA